MMMFKKAYNLRIINFILAVLLLCANPAYSLRVPLDSACVQKFINPVLTINLASFIISKFLDKDDIAVKDLTLPWDDSFSTIHSLLKDYYNVKIENKANIVIISDIGSIEKAEKYLSPEGLIVLTFQSDKLKVSDELEIKEWDILAKQRALTDLGYNTKCIESAIVAWKGEPYILPQKSSIIGPEYKLGEFQEIEPGIHEGNITIHDMEFKLNIAMEKRKRIIHRYVYTLSYGDLKVGFATWYIRKDKEGKPYFELSMDRDKNKFAKRLDMLVDIPSVLMNMALNDISSREDIAEFSKITIDAVMALEPDPRLIRLIQRFNMKAKNTEDIISGNRSVQGKDSDLPYFEVIYNNGEEGIYDDEALIVLAEKRSGIPITDSAIYSQLSKERLEKIINGKDNSYITYIGGTWGFDLESAQSLQETYLPKLPSWQSTFAFRKVISLIKAMFSNTDNISFADLDTGTGEFVTSFTNFLKVFFKNVRGVGIESLPQYIKQAQENEHNVVYGLSEIKHDYKKAGLIDNSRDIVTINNIDRKLWALIPQADRILKPNGLIIVTVKKQDIDDGRKVEGQRIDEAAENLLLKRGYTTARIPFPDDYPHSVRFEEADFILIAWKAKFMPNLSGILEISTPTNL
ncbi:MAG: hypothetical protein P9L93_05670 [Candidatus Gorgyraea atricola]|nr:hypothetical protein [Candidatus Gorgyraea atricola]